MSYQIETRQLDSQPTLSVRATTTPAELANVLGMLFSRVVSFAQDCGAEIAGRPFTRYHGFDDKTVELEAGLPVASKTPGKGEVSDGELPACQAAVTVHVGPYSRLAEAHVAMGAWLDQTGRQLAGPPWEVYLTDPSQVPDPEGWRTEIVYPLK